LTAPSWRAGATSPDIDWRKSGALENVPRGDGDLAEVTSLAGAVAAWLPLDPAHRKDARLTPEHPLMIDGVRTAMLTGNAIAVLADRLPAGAGVSELPVDQVKQL
jgi:hypothetical protein